MTSPPSWPEPTPTDRKVSSGFLTDRQRKEYRELQGSLAAGEISPTDFEEERKRMFAPWMDVALEDWSEIDWREARREARLAARAIDAPSDDQIAAFVRWSQADPDEWSDSDWLFARRWYQENTPTDPEITAKHRALHASRTSSARMRDETADLDRRLAESQRRIAELHREGEEIEQRRLDQNAEAARREAGIRSLADITGCRLVAGGDEMSGPVNVTIRFRDPEVLTILGRGGSECIDWGEIESVVVEALSEQSQVTASRVAGLGLLSLAAKKRTPWCAMTIVRGTRHIVFEVPRAAHRLHGELATAGVWRLA
jgi:hypothetical protein